MHIINESVIEYADVAITSLDYNGPITVLNSTIQKCGGIISASDYDLISSIGDGMISATGADIGCILPMANISNEIQIVESDFIIDDDYSTVLPLKQDQIDLNGVSVFMAGTDITNSSEEDLTGVKSARGRVFINNACNFNGLGVVKNLDVLNLCSPRGLYVFGSFFNESGVSNYSSYIHLRNSKFDGGFSSVGFTNGNIYANKILGFGNLISDPIRSFIMKENLFQGPYLDLRKNNGATNALCNEWRANSSGYAFEALSGTVLLPSWGSSIKPSGNKNDNNPRPDMLLQGNGPAEFTNWYVNTTPFLFDYAGLAQGRITEISNSGCLYNLYPLTAPIFDDEWVVPGEDISELDGDYLALLEDIEDLTEDLGQLIGSDTIEKHIHIIGQKKTELYELVRRATYNMALSDSNDVNDWVDRIAPFQILLSQYLVKWYEADFDFLKSDLFSNPDGDAAVLYDATSYMDEITNIDRSIYELNEVQLDSLMVLAGSSRGSYTNILRTFLDSEYDLHVQWTDSISPRSAAYVEPSQINSFRGDERFSLSPNPTTDCFSTSTNLVDIEYQIDIFDWQGKLIKSAKAMNSARICMGDLLPGLYLITFRDLNSGYAESKKVILNKQ